MDWVNVQDRSIKWGIILACFQFLFIVIALMIDQPLIMLVPVVLVMGLVFISRIEWLFILFALIIPFSVEVEIPGGLGTDLPSEPVMWILTGMGVLYLVTRPQLVNDLRWKHPISIILIGHVLWIGLTAILSQDVLISVKFFLAKIWYVVPFYFLFAAVQDDALKISRFFKILVIAMGMAIVIVMFRHAGYGFSFRNINEAVHPIFRNHVNYACMLVAIIPFVWAFFRTHKTKIWGVLLFLFILAIYLSYTRAAILALLIGVGGYLVIRLKMSRLAIMITICATFIAVPYLLNENRYLDYAPEYERAIAHYKFDNLIEATYKFEDISTMERLYRWVAGKEMIVEKPIFGFGPGTFYSFYQDYAISEFQTYVSNNPEKSGIHNYYLMTLVEQGVIGFLFFLGLIISAIIYGEKAYHRIKNKADRYLVMAACLSLIMTAAILIINDMVEADKVGPFLFIGMTIIMTSHIKTVESNNE